MWRQPQGAPSWQHHGHPYAQPYGQGQPRGRGGARSHQPGGRGAARGFGSKGGSRAASWGAAPLVRGEFDWDSAPTLVGQPEVETVASYSYAHKSAETVDVVCPAWTARVLAEMPEAPHIDLCLERCLEPLQAPDGGFELTVELISALGLSEPGCVLAQASSPGARTLGALLVLKAAAHYLPDRWPPRLASLCSRAEAMACQSLALAPAELWSALEAVGDPLEPPASLPGPAVAALLANFAPSGRWSFFELWARLLPEDKMCALREEGGVLCPRFFLVDLACAPQSPYDIGKSFPLVRQGPCVFVGQPASDDGGGRDAMRQGRQLEASFVSFSWLEEDHVLTELRLPLPPDRAATADGSPRVAVRALYSAAPDAIEARDDLVTPTEPLAPGDDEAYEAAGYSLEATFPVCTGKHDCCRIWRADRQEAPADAYVEVKKTTHLEGAPGQFKIMKFWMQAALMGCGAVVVATTQGSADGNVACGVRRLEVGQCEEQVDAQRVWGSLESMLRHVLEETSAAQGRWTLHVHKERGRGARVRLLLERGWQGDGCDDGLVGIEERLKGLFD